MFGKALWFGGLLLLAGATVLVTPGSSQAQHRGGGGHGGGFHGGGFHGGGFHGGGINHGGINHGGGFRHGGGFHHGGGFRHDGFHHGGRLYGAWPFYYSSYPYYGYYYPESYNTYRYGSSSPAYDSGNYGSNGGVTSSYPDSYSPATAQPDTSAHVTVSVPADAEIWFDDTHTTVTGAVREYQSPPLAPGSKYTYELRARWNENGHVVTQTQQVEVTAGAHVNVHFPVLPTKAPTAPSR
jgi:uncharacterized protein (TIGR03000 family)